MTPLRAEGESFAYALNASGTLAGWAKDSEFRLHAVRGGERFSDDLGATSGGARGINARGVVVGTTVAEETSERAFQRSPSGETIDLGTLGGTHSRAFAVNDAGLVVGDAGIQGDAASHAFAWSEASGRLEDLGTLPGGRHSHAYAVNAAGLVVGASEDGSHQFQPVRYANGKVERIGDKGGRAYGVNAHGDVVGSWGGCRAFVALAGQEPIELKSLVGNAEGWEFWEARGINDAGQIVGWGIHEGGMRGFLLEPRDGAGGAGDGTAALAGGTLRFRAQPAVTDGTSLLAFGLPLPAAGRITLFTVAGRQVRSLEAPLAATGVEWDGRDDAGRRVSSGLFLARLEFPGVKAVTRVTVVN
jgi:probable HAF family extracellular repeat protein